MKANSFYPFSFLCCGLIKTIKMKYTFTTILLVVAAGTFAQFQPKDKVLGFNFNLGASTTSSTFVLSSSEQKQFTTGLGLSLGWASKENQINGFFVSGNLSQTKTTVTPQQNADARSTGSGIRAGYFIQKYKSLGKGFFIFGEGNLSGGYGKNENKTNGQAISTSENISVGLSFYPGVAYKVNKNLLLQISFADFASIGYSHNKQESQNQGKTTSNGFNLGTSLGLGYLQNIGIGARWVIPHKKTS